MAAVNARARDAKNATRDATAFWQTFWFATRGRDAEHDAVVAKWIRRDQRLAAVFLSATGVERSVKLDAVEKALGTRVSLGAAAPRARSGPLRKQGSPSTRRA